MISHIHENEIFSHWLSRLYDLAPLPLWLISYYSSSPSYTLAMIPPCFAHRSASLHLRAFNLTIPSPWNALPLDIYIAKIYSLFVSSLKHHLVNEDFTDYPKITTLTTLISFPLLWFFPISFIIFTTLFLLIYYVYGFLSVSCYKNVNSTRVKFLFGSVCFTSVRNSTWNAGGTQIFETLINKFLRMFCKWFEAKEIHYFYSIFWTITWKTHNLLYCLKNLRINGEL